MATSLKELEKEIQNDHLQTDAYYLVKKVQKSVQSILK